ncbi:Probable folate-biopterin transporter 2 [Durusdinium trenchii]|uniref:Probable folate-biopterin transporter 2 n=1 Tax=Durusdinium trenchii TaxID=1381693 RepID=A0ABP0PV09_9DINO
MVSADTENAEGPVLLGQRIPQHDLEDEKDLNVSAKGDKACQQIPVQGRACTPCLGWFQMLYATFGSFVPLGMLVYGLQESFAKSSGDFACKYYMMDVLKLDGATMGRLQTAAKVPWDIKPVLGMCSDALPLWGFHRTSYLVSACVFSSFLYLWVGFNAVSALGLYVCMTGLNLSIAFADLVIDATAASLAKDHPKEASDMQAAFNIAQALGGMAASSIKGYLVAVLGSRGTMMSNVFCAVAVFIPAIRRWLPEEQLLSGHCTPKLSQFRRNSSITAVAIFLSVVAVGLSLSQIFLQEWRTRALVTLFCCIVVTISAYKAMRKISPFLANTGMLLFWRAVLQPGLGEAMFVWMSKDEEGPRFSPQLMGLADCFGQAGFLLGVVVYNRFLRTWKYRRIFLVGQIMVVASQVLDFILVMRWNQALGIPDVLFFLGDSTFEEAVVKTFYVPLVVLAYKVCPSNLEGTIFSTLISLNCIGVSSGKYLGITLCDVWGIVDGNSAEWLPQEEYGYQPIGASQASSPPVPNPAVRYGRACSTPCLGWFQMLYATFGSFVPLGMLVYGLQESFAKSSGDFACKYYMMDVLKLDGATMGRLQTAAHVPWDIKPVLGMCSDALPLWGFHRTSYLVCACVFSICLYLWVGFNAVSALGLFAYLTGLNLAIAFADLVIDATAASLAKDHPKAASDMQTALRVAEASGGMAASSIKGYLVAVLGSRGTMMSNVVCAVAVFIPAIRRWLPEEQLLGGRCTPKLSQFRKNSSITAVAIFLSVVAVGLSLSHIFLQEWRTRALVTLFCCIVVTISAYKAMRKISPFLANTGMLLFWRAVLQPGLGEAMFVWMSKDEEGPRFSPQLMGLADCFGQAGFLLGVVVYNRFLRTWKYRRIFLVGQIMVVASQVLDFILVMRWNQALGIPDVLFFLGDSTFDHAVAKTFYVPLVVLAYKVCPSNLEGTIFSTLISLNNIGVDCGKYLGITLCEVWGIVDGNFDHLPHGVVSKALVRRGGLKHVGNALNHAGKLNQVDHPLSAGGLAQARQLRQQIAALASDSQPSQAASSLLRCRRWYISPFLRALETAAYALSPLKRLATQQGERLLLRVSPQANEIVQTSMSLDCQGKKGNVGFKVVTRAVSKLAETLEEEEDDPANQASVQDKQAELSEAIATLCAFDISEIAQVWWTEVSSFKKENLRAEDSRVKSLVKRILVEDEEPVIGLVAHSILFKRMIQLFWPKDRLRQEELRTALRNGAQKQDTVDPFEDKVMNCGTLVLTFRYHSGGCPWVVPQMYAAL